SRASLERRHARRIQEAGRYAGRAGLEEGRRRFGSRERREDDRSRVHFSLSGSCSDGAFELHDRKNCGRLQHLGRIAVSNSRASYRRCHPRTAPRSDAIRSCASSACRTTSGLGSALIATVRLSLFIGFVRRVVIQQLGGREDRRGRGEDLQVCLPCDISVENSLMIPGESFIEGFLWCQKLGPQPFGDPEGIATRMPLPLGKLNGKLLQTGRQHGDDPFSFALCHLCLLVESALEYLFE